MRRLDHALQDTTRLQFPIPGREPPEGLLTMKTDLSGFFELIATIGRNEALLLLVVRAYRVRDGLLDVYVNDLAWTLRTSNRTILAWLDKLVARGLVVYTVKPFPLITETIDRVQVEIVGQRASRLFEARARQDLPTHWIPTVLPLHGRVTFTVFLFHVWREVHQPSFHIDELVTATRLRNRWHARWHLWRLRRRRLLVRRPDGLGLLLVRDPPPPTRFQRLRLRYLSIPHLRRSLVHITLLAAAVALLLALLFLLPHAP